MSNWLITGTSSGLGRAIAVAALEAGHSVAGTVRSLDDARAFEDLGAEARAFVADVAHAPAVFAAVEEAQTAIGPIDVVVANAGYGHEGTFEETSIEQLRRQLEVNVIGAAATIQAVLPSMRERRAGRIFAITSMAGLTTMPGLTAYHASKYALEGLCESLGKEVAHLGIHVTAVAPGSFRTSWAGRSMVRSPNAIADYDEVFAPLRANRQAADGNQLGDPAKAAAAIVQVAAFDDPPAHLVLGSDALRLVAAGRAALQAELDCWDDLSRSTDHAEGAQIA
jgi:NAD(P)-dependent dehydrogenase (short-subunit alcohol dehydrogenase family)